jgi:hypothetical protein
MSELMQRPQLERYQSLLPPLVFNRAEIPSGVLVALIVCASLLCRVDRVRAGDVCDVDGQYGMLEVAKVNQEETAWCWVASSKAITNRFQMPSPANLYSQCTLYNMTKNPSDNCCGYPAGSRPASCQSSGWPWDVFAVTFPNIDYRGEATPMEWPDIRNQICPAGTPGTPFIFIAQPATGGLPHTHVVKGYDRVVEGGGLWVDDHNVLANCAEDRVNCEVGARFIDYECKYKLPAGCQEPSTKWNRTGDLLDLKKLSIPSHPTVPADVRAPSPPGGIRKTE